MPVPLCYHACALRPTLGDTKEPNNCNESAVFEVDAVQVNIYYHIGTGLECGDV